MYSLTEGLKLSHTSFKPKSEIKWCSALADCGLGIDWFDLFNRWLRTVFISVPIKVR